ncbi:right-handed parallel beta-helix repeat-containing protein [Alienimonas californiensis]|uniref:Pectate lyase superfamily protein n=1 Tax=Alienimonas californiensis TaxID=2527989 RepID=A0A517P8G8_9PLAN|nr:right-handed parallel beta-helix repeat-containing protein [Alienimonas californiensis]QDT15672.1 Pectate lyase superfamily protein [Alienimonas californiensis]
MIALPSFVRPLLVVGLLPLGLSAAPAPAPVAAEIVGDGVADDTAALQALIDAGGAVTLPAGPLRITAPLVVDLTKSGRTSVSGAGVARLVMAGPGPAIRVVGSHDGTADPASVKDQVWANENAPMLDGFEIVGVHPQADGVEAEGTMQLTLTRLVVRQARHAVRLTGRNRNVTLSDCHLYENAGVGVFLDGVNLHQIGLSNCHVSYNFGGGVVLRDSEVRNLQIAGCDIEGNTGPAGDRGAPANVWLDSTNRSVAEVAIVGCTIQHGHDAPDSANIRIGGQAEPRPYDEGERRVGNVLIADNVLSDVRVNVELKGVRAATVTGNTLWQGYAANLVAEDCTRLVIANNVLDRSPRYNYSDAAEATLGVRLERCTDGAVTGNLSSGEVKGEAAFIFRDCDRINVAGNTITDYGAAGLLLDGVTNSLITGNLIRDDRPDAAGEPIRTANLRGVTFTGNLLGDEANEGERGAPAP